MDDPCLSRGFSPLDELADAAVALQQGLERGVIARPERLLGHQRLGELPTTRKWQAVVTLIGGGADVRDVAAATADAAEAALAAAAADPELHHAFWLLARIPLAAREPDFAAGLGRLGLAVGDRPTLVEVCSAMVEAVDDAAREHGRTDDFSEMATLAAAESLSGVAGREGPGLFGAAYRADETRAALHRLAADGPFAVLARDFLARLMRHVLDYYLSRELANHVGVGRRYRSLKDHHDFDRALDRHCHEAAVIAQDYAAEWYSKAKYECGVDRPRAAAFVRYALQKLRRELEVRWTVHA